MNWPRERFAAFILTHGRPDRVYTYNTLRKSGYTGPIYLIVDDEDKTKGEYIKKFRDEVIIFSKSEIAKTFDQADNFNDRRAIVYARNACFDIAERLGLRYFLQLDDDYTAWDWRYPDNENYLSTTPVTRRLDELFSILLRYYKSIPAASIAFAQGGDFLGGGHGGFAEAIGRRRKCMNSFFCSTERRFQFVGRINEDVNTYTMLGSRGLLFMTICNLSLQQKQTQSNAGGMTELYLDSGTYLKSFYSVMFCPSAVRIRMMGEAHRRLHHQIKWAHAVPQIIRETHKKRR